MNNAGTVLVQNMQRNIITYDTLLFIIVFGITLALKLHLEQTFCPGPHFNLPLNNSHARVTTQPSGNKHSVFTEYTEISFENIQSDRGCAVTTT